MGRVHLGQNNICKVDSPTHPVPAREKVVRSSHNFSQPLTGRILRGIKLRFTKSAEEQQHEKRQRCEPTATARDRSI